MAPLRLPSRSDVVVKMDVEGAETVLVPHLIASNVTSLIDEFFVELHSPPAQPAKAPQSPRILAVRDLEPGRVELRWSVADPPSAARCEGCLYEGIATI